MQTTFIDENQLEMLTLAIEVPIDPKKIHVIAQGEHKRRLRPERHVRQAELPRHR